MSLALFASALAAELPEAVRRGERLGLSAADAWNVLVVAQLREVLLGLAGARGHEPEALSAGRLFQGVPGFEADGLAARRQQLLDAWRPRLASPAGLDPEPEAFGQLYESLLAARPQSSEPNLRKRTGSYYTPAALTRVVAGRGDGPSGARPAD